MTRIRFISIVLTVVMCVSALTGCGNTGKSSQKEYGSKYRVCMITDAGDITDQSFNQTTYESCRDYCKENKYDFTYKKPDGDTNYARIAMVDVAVAEGYNIIVMSGYIFASTLVEVTDKYPDIKFIALDLGEGDICAAAVGDKYYANPDAYDVKDYYNENNTYLAVYQEVVPGYLAGYTAVRLGYKKLGYLGGQAVPAVMRFGYGFVQGINAAAEELGVQDQVEVQYAYGGQFYGSTEITAVMDTWYSSGTEVVFACGGGIYTSAAEAAAKVGGKLIGVDSDQSPIINKYGKDMTVTSAMKSLRATIFARLDDITKNGTWKEHVGTVENLGLVSGTEMDLNYVGLPLDTTQWNDDFTVDDYKQLVMDIYDGKITISDDISAMPATSVKVTERQGTIK